MQRPSVRFSGKSCDFRLAWHHPIASEIPGNETDRMATEFATATIGAK